MKLLFLNSGHLSASMARCLPGAKASTPLAAGAERRTEARRLFCLARNGREALRGK
jgi:hypothetical protein